MVPQNIKEPRRLFIFAALVMGLSACSIEASISSITDAAPLELEKATGAEFVSGSNQFDQTLLRNYKINSSAGSMTQEIQSETPRGYKMFSSVQGALISSQETP